MLGRVAVGCSWLRLAALPRRWLLLAAVGCCWLRLAAFPRRWLRLVAVAFGSPATDPFGGGIDARAQVIPPPEYCPRKGGYDDLDVMVKGPIMQVGRQAAVLLGALGHAPGLRAAAFRSLRARSCWSHVAPCSVGGFSHSAVLLGTCPWTHKWPRAGGFRAEWHIRCDECGSSQHAPQRLQGVGGEEREPPRPIDCQRCGRGRQEVLEEHHVQLANVRRRCLWVRHRPGLRHLERQQAW